MAEAVLRALGDLAAGRPAPPGLRPEVLEDLRRLIDGSDGVGRRCLVEFAVVGTPTWQFSPVSFVPLLNLDGSAAGAVRDEGARVTTIRLEGYRSAVSFQSPPEKGTTPVALPAGSPCAPATPGVPVQLPDYSHRALRGEALAVLVEWRDGAWVATGVDSVGVAFPWAGLPALGTGSDPEGNMPTTGPSPTPVPPHRRAGETLPSPAQAGCARVYRRQDAAYRDTPRDGRRFGGADRRS